MVVSFLEWLLDLKTVDRWYGQSMELPAATAFHQMRERLAVRVTVPPDAASLVPEVGPAIVISNHPTGGVDTILLMSFLLTVRRDVKLVSHVWFKRYPELAKYMIFVDPDADGQRSDDNRDAMKEALRWVGDGHVLATYPAGAVSFLRRRPFEVTDPEWRPGAARMIRAAGVPVLPVYFRGRNSVLFQLTALVHPPLRRFLLAREMINKHGRSFELCVGRPIPFERLTAIRGDAELAAHLRARTYELRTTTR